MSIFKDRSFRILMMLAVTFALSFGLPHPKYKSTDVLKQLHIPTYFAGWLGRDLDTAQKLMDENYNFINALFLREYTDIEGKSILLYFLDAGNFHNPKVCLTGAGFKIHELDDTVFTFKTPARGKAAPFSGTSIYISNKENGALVTYWMIINGRKVGWIQQKMTEFWCSLIGKRKAGLMVRIDFPTTEADLPHAREMVRSFVASLEHAVTPEDRWLIFGR